MRFTKGNVPTPCQLSNDCARWRVQLQSQLVRLQPYLTYDSTVANYLVTAYVGGNVKRESQL
jgi:hypothetical protein